MTMAKRRRKPNQRHRPHAEAGAVRTAESGEDAKTGSRGHGARPGSKAVRERPPASPGHVARTEKKEMARRQREEVRRRVRRAERNRRLAQVAVAAVVIGAAVVWFTRDTTPAEPPATLPGELATAAPWPANVEQVEERVDLLGLPGAGSARHWHANLRVFVDGVEQSVPVNLGLDGDFHAPLHTHSADGVLHIESNDAGHDFTLGEFFDVWGVRLTGRCLGASCESGEDALRVFVAGEEVTTGSIRDVQLDDEVVYVVAFGTPEELPQPIPSTFDFTTVRP
jgi:hypothetical protein